MWTCNLTISSGKPAFFFINVEASILYLSYVVNTSFYVEVEFIYLFIF